MTKPLIGVGVFLMAHGNAFAEDALANNVGFSLATSRFDR